MTEKVKLSTCLLRFQKPVPRLNPKVTPTSFSPVGTPNTASENVANAINSFHNDTGRNHMLWLSGSARSMVYAGVDESPFHPVLYMPTPQDGLNGDDVVVRILLPSGMAKVVTCTAVKADIGGMHANLVGRIFGISLKRGAHPLQESDFAYATAKDLKAVYKSMRHPTHRLAAGDKEGFTEDNGRIVIFEMDHPFGGVV